MEEDENWGWKGINVVVAGTNTRVLVEKRLQSHHSDATTQKTGSGGEAGRYPENDDDVLPAARPPKTISTHNPGDHLGPSFSRHFSVLPCLFPIVQPSLWAIII